MKVKGKLKFDDVHNEEQMHKQVGKLVARYGRYNLVLALAQNAQTQYDEEGWTDSNSVSAQVVALTGAAATIREFSE